jgi:hypothetical protein
MTMLTRRSRAVLVGTASAALLFGLQWAVSAPAFASTSAQVGMPAQPGSTAECQVLIVS